MRREMSDGARQRQRVAEYSSRVSYRTPTACRLRRAARYSAQSGWSKKINNRGGTAVVPSPSARVAEGDFFIGYKGEQYDDYRFVKSKCIALYR